MTTRRRCKHLSAAEEQQIIEFDRARVTINEFCASMGIHPSTYASVLYRHGIRKGKSHKDNLIRDWMREQRRATESQLAP